MRKSFVSALLCVPMVLTTLVGCTGGTDQAPEKETTKQEEAQKEEVVEKAEEKEEVATTEGKTIVYWSMWESTEAQGQVIQQVVDQYEADTGNTVDLQFKGRTGIREGLQAALDAGTTIDLFDEDIDRVNTTWGDYLLDLEQFVADSNYEETAIPGLMTAVRTEGGGTIKSIPYQPNIFAYFYNKDLFEQAGIEAVPTTWDEFLAVCEKLKAVGITPVTSDDAYITSTMGYHLARLVGEDQVVKIVNEGLWAEEPAVLEMAQDIEEMASKGYFSEYIASNVWPAGQNTELALGEAAMYLNGSWLPNEVLGMTGPDFRWGAFSYPAVEGGVDGVEAANFGAQVFAINKDTAVSEEAFELITYITKGEFDAQLSAQSVGIPADTTNTEWPTLLQDVRPVLNSLENRYAWSAGADSNVDMTPIIKENFLKLCGGELTAQEFVDTMEAASN